MSRLEPALGIPRRYLHDEIAERLRELILVGELEPKSRINELELCERFGTSRTPLREAIKILATEGLLELLPNRGARVASISQTEIDDMIEVVAGLEAIAAELACRVITDAEIDAIEVRHVTMKRAFERGDDTRYFTLNREIHEAVMAASRNQTLQAVYASLSSRIQRMRYTAHKSPEQWQRAMDEHDRMLALLKARNGAALALVMKDHIRGKKAIIEAAYGEARPDNGQHPRKLP
jgi:DNA-binding GntR family transcriptional regulator